MKVRLVGPNIERRTELSPAPSVIPEAAFMLDSAGLPMIFFHKGRLPNGDHLYMQAKTIIDFSRHDRILPHLTGKE
jgi:hypothetical protein